MKTNRPSQRRQDAKRGRPTTQQSALLTKHIVDSGWQVVLNSGPENFSVDRVVAAAHASKQTVYARFSGKPDLLQAILTSRVDMILAEMKHLKISDDIRATFADFARRVFMSLTAPEARMLDRLVDWIDANSANGEHHPMRSRISKQMEELVERHLRQAMQSWSVVVDDVPAAAAFWLDCTVGHVRNRPGEDTQREKWVVQFVDYYLRAVFRQP